MNQTVGFDIEQTNSKDYVREIGGDLLSCDIAQTDVLRFERLTRRFNGAVHWHFKQPRLALLRHGPGVTSELVVDGVSYRGGASDNATMTVLPANMKVEGVFVPGNAGTLADYSIAFLSNDFVHHRVGSRIDRPMIAQQSAALANRLVDLAQEAENRDNLFDLYAEGWACQVLVLTSRLMGGAPPARRSTRGGIAPVSVRRIDEFIEMHLDSELRLADLARIAGLSKHHFLRAFRQTTGETPHQYVLAARIRAAKRKLATPAGSGMTEIALACGFSNSQNFSTIFRKSTGLTPSTFRRQSLS